MTLLISLLMVCSLMVSIYYNDGYAYVYLRQIVIMLIFSYLLKYKVKLSDITKLRIPDLFFTTTMIWLYVILVCMLPYIVILNYTIPNAVFEITSGVTTTGASIIPSLEDVPISLVFWRSITQWLGGIGFIVVGVLILPNLNTGGMELFKTESSDSEGKTFAHLRDMALTILCYYFVLTFLCAVTYWYQGMTKIDAVQFSFTTLATGGFSPHDEPFEGILHQYWGGAVFLYLATLPFQVFTLNIIRATPLKIFKDPQVRTYSILCVVGATLITLERYFNDPNPELIKIPIYFKDGLINILNVASNCGYTISSYWEWGSLTYAVMIVLALFGGCAGSTAGGMKIFRINILFLFLKNQFIRTIHPSANNLIVYNHRIVNDDDIRAVLFFLMLFICSFGVGMLVLTASGLTLAQAANSVMTCMTNTGFSFGPNISDNGTFAAHTDFQKIVDSVLMVIGRLEFTTLIIILTPRFWKY